MNDFTQAVNTIARTHVMRCYQCGRCSGNCPMAREMDLLPHQVIQHVLMGIHEVCDAKTVWLCDGCHTCSERCPREIDVAAVIDALRMITTRREAPLAKFNESLLSGVRRTGRVNEMPLGLHFNLTSKRGLFSGAGDAVHLLKKGKLSLVPHRSANLSKLIDRAMGGEDE
ncbi:MAG: heterodisulfide reductase subunit C [Armatimonadia bacterium]|nr:heterodisulfide reductase subunit C [Armatimonadia bacterium]